MDVAVLGTGIMGAAMARSIARAGHTVRAWNRTRAKAEPLAGHGIEVAGTAAEKWRLRRSALPRERRHASRGLMGYALTMAGHAGALSVGLSSSTPAERPT